MSGIVGKKRGSHTAAMSSQCGRGHLQRMTCGDQTILNGADHEEYHSCSQTM